jgi:TonB family protein
VRGRRARAGSLALAALITTATSAFAVEEAPREWQAALDLRKAVTLKSEHVAVDPGALEAAGVDAGTFTPPKRIEGSSPAYPEAAARDGAQGTVLLECLISERGAVDACVVSHSVHPAADRAAIRAIRRWRYEPARVAGRPRTIVARFMMIFRLQ